MVLSARPADAHNAMLGKLIRHPPSTNFEEANGQPPKKKLKRLESADSIEAGYISSENDLHYDSPKKKPREIPDSEEEHEGVVEEDDGPSAKSGRLTDLETALPFVNTDKEAIADYEAHRAADGPATALDRDGRLGQRKWVKGKSSIYVDAFNLALETVLEEEGHLFDVAEMAVFTYWRALDYEAQYLYVRLFLRKTSAWHRVNRLRYYSDIADLLSAADTLQVRLELPASSAEVQATPGELTPPADTTLGHSFTFADRSEGEITSLDEASSLLNLEELKEMAKDAKVQGKNKAELLRALRRTSSKQSGLGWGGGLRRTESQDTTLSNGSGLDQGEAADADTTPLEPDSDGLGVSRDKHFVRKILSCTGPCIRLSQAPLKLFERVHLVFYRSTEWTEKSLTTIILARISRRNFPEYIVSRSTNIFPSRALLLEFEASIRTQFRVDNILEFNGNPSKDGLQQVLYIFDEVHPRWKVLLVEEREKEERQYDSCDGAYLRRFSPAWVYTRIVHKGTYVLGRLKNHKREHEILSELLSQRLFHTSRRGAWYQRKALLEEHYMAPLVSPPANLSPEGHKKHWKRSALATCEEGLRDRDCHHIYHYDLQKRIMKLEKNLKIPKREQHDFGHVQLAKPIERVVEGIRVQKEQPLPNHRRSSGDLAGTGLRGSKTIWIDEREGGGECSVEEMCLSWYRSQGWKGYHSEGGIVRTLFAYLFASILYLYIPNVFQTPFQTAPLDLHTDAFYLSRQTEISHRLAAISNGNAERLVREVHSEHSQRQTCIVGLDWGFALEDLVEIVRCFNNDALATICKVMAQEYRHRGGGIPDLFLWSPEKNQVRFVEVKSENDRLSDTQRLWIHVLMGVGVTVELCAAREKEVRVVEA